MSASEDIQKILGFNPAKTPGPNKSAIDKAVAKLLVAREEKSAAAAEELLTKAIGLAEQLAAIEKEFKKKKEAVEKEIQKLVSQVQNALSGRDAAPTTDEPIAPQG